PPGGTKIFGLYGNPFAGVPRAFSSKKVRTGHRGAAPTAVPAMGETFKMVLRPFFRGEVLATRTSPDLMMGSSARPAWISATLNFTEECLPPLCRKTSTIEFAVSSNPPALVTNCRRVSPLNGKTPGFLTAPDTVTRLLLNSFTETVTCGF